MLYLRGLTVVTSRPSLSYVELHDFLYTLIPPVCSRVSRLARILALWLLARWELDPRNAPNESVNISNAFIVHVYVRAYASHLFPAMPALRDYIVLCIFPFSLASLLVRFNPPPLSPSAVVPHADLPLFHFRAHGPRRTFVPPSPLRILCCFMHSPRPLRAHIHVLSLVIHSDLD